MREQYSQEAEGFPRPAASEDPYAVRISSNMALEMPAAVACIRRLCAHALHFMGVAVRLKEGSLQFVLLQMDDGEVTVIVVFEGGPKHRHTGVRKQLAAKPSTAFGRVSGACWAVCFSFGEC